MIIESNFVMQYLIKALAYNESYIKRAGTPNIKIKINSAGVIDIHCGAPVWCIKYSGWEYK
jgi:hypothetical protein